MLSFQVNVKDPKMSSLVCYHKNGLERSRVALLSFTGTPGKVSCIPLKHEIWLDNVLQHFVKIFTVDRQVSGMLCNPVFMNSKSTSAVRFACKWDCHLVCRWQYFMWIRVKWLLFLWCHFSHYHQKQRIFLIKEDQQFCTVCHKTFWPSLLKL